MNFKTNLNCNISFSLLTASGKSFELFYTEGRTTIKASEFQLLIYMNVPDFWFWRQLRFVAQTHEDGDKHTMELTHCLYNSFVIESLPAESNEKCGITGLSKSIELKKCKGKIKARKP